MFQSNILAVGSEQNGFIVIISAFKEVGVNIDLVLNEQTPLHKVQNPRSQTVGVMHVQPQWSTALKLIDALALLFQPSYFMRSLQEVFADYCFSNLIEWMRILDQLWGDGKSVVKRKGVSDSNVMEQFLFTQRHLWFWLVGLAIHQIKLIKYLGLRINIGEGWIHFKFSLLLFCYFSRQVKHVLDVTHNDRVNGSEAQNSFWNFKRFKPLFYHWDGPLYGVRLLSKQTKVLTFDVGLLLRFCLDDTQLVSGCLEHFNVVCRPFVRLHYCIDWAKWFCWLLQLKESTEALNLIFTIGLFVAIHAWTVYRIKL